MVRGASGACFFTPADFFQGEVPLWKGSLMLVQNADIEDERLWVEHSIALAISLDSDYLRDANTEHEAWIRYPFGRQGRNMPVVPPPSIMYERMRECLPFIVGGLASGKNVALHCTHLEQEGKIGLLLLALAFNPPGVEIMNEVDAVHVLRALDLKWEEAFGQAATGREQDGAWLVSFLDAGSGEMVPEVRLPSWLWTDEPTDDHTMVSLGFTADEIKHWHVVTAIIKCEDDEDRQLEQLDLLLTASQVGIIDGLPIDELAELKSEWRRSYGGSRSDVAAQGGKSSGKGGGQSFYPRDSQEGSRPSSRPTPTSPSRPTPRPSARPMPKRRPHQADPIMYPAAGSSSTWGSGPAARSLAPPPLVLPPLTYRASSTRELRPVVVPRGSVDRAWKEEEPPPPAEGQQPDALRHQMTFLLDVCRVPIDAVSEKRWAVWRDESTVLHLMAEHINARRGPQGWLNLVQVEDFITIFKQRGGNIDAFTDDIKSDPEPGSTALHIVAQR